MSSEIKALQRSLTTLLRTFQEAHSFPPTLFLDDKNQPHTPRQVVKRVADLSPYLASSTFRASLPLLEESSSRSFLRLTFSPHSSRSVDIKIESPDRDSLSFQIRPDYSRNASPIYFSEGKKVSRADISRQLSDHLH